MFLFGGGGGVCFCLLFLCLVARLLVSATGSGFIHELQKNHLTAYQYLDFLFNVQTGNLVFLWVSSQTRLSDKACKVISIEREMYNGKCTSYGD